MKLYCTIVDDFLLHWPTLRTYADTAAYQDVVSPVDGVTYPGICTLIPSVVVLEVAHRLGGVMGSQVEIKTIFLRQSVEGVRAPHAAHNDISMGQFSLMLFLNREEHCRGGTELLKHVATGIYGAPETDEQVAILRRDSNKRTAWERVLFCEMRPNRAFIFDAALQHQALPQAGFGSTREDGRLLLTAFFDIRNAKRADPKRH